MTRSPWSTDLTALCERLARRLRSEGAEHPEAGAVALAVRGHHGLDRSEMTTRLGLDDDELAVIEAGERPWSRLPDQLKDDARVLDGLDLDALGLS